MAEHSFLSASSAHRWLKCTPSRYLEEQEGLEECSIFAEEGTAAHTLAELKLSYAFGKMSDEEYATRFKVFVNENSDYYDKVFEEHIDNYVNFVKHITRELHDVKTYFEVRVDFANIVQDGFGTADCILISGNTAHVIDLKFGQGVPVTASSNPQLMLYGIGVINMFPNVEQLYMTIYQPRLDNVDTVCLSKEELMTWGNDYVKPRAEKAFKGEGILEPSESACKFCALRGKCKARADMQLDIAKKEFSIEDTKSNMVQALSPEQISNILEIAPMFIDWFKDVQAFALGQLAQGVKIPGYKLVEGRSNRVITNPSKVKEILLGVGLKESDIMKPQEMQGITKLEELVGKKLFETLCGEHLIKPRGKLTLATESDRRPEVNSIDVDFSINYDENN